MTKDEKDKMIEELVAGGMTEQEAEAKANAVDNPPTESEENDDEAGTEQEAGESPADSPDDASEGDAGADDAEDREAENTDAAADELKAANEALQVRLQEALVRIDGRLADPTDLPFDPSFIDDPEALDAAITALVKKKPGLMARQPGGNIGNGKRGAAAKPKPDLVSILKGL